jgi:hypothetical protein
MPPNCSLSHYYKEIGVCEPVALCSKIKNPVNYTTRKLRFRERAAEEEKPRRRKRKSR